MLNNQLNPLVRESLKEACHVAQETYRHLLFLGKITPEQHDRYLDRITANYHKSQPNARPTQQEYLCRQQSIGP